MSSWTERPLGELLDVLIDHRGKTPKKLGGDGFTDFGVPVVSAMHVRNGRVDLTLQRRYVPEWMFKRWMPVRLQRGDVLLTSEAATFGAIAQVPTNDDLVLSQRLFALRGRSGVLDSSYLRYFLESEPGQQRLRERASGSSVTGIRQSELVRVLVPLRDFAEQRRVAAVLGALDDLIENHRTQALASIDLAKAVIQAAPADRRVRVVDEANVRRGLSYKGAGLAAVGMPMVNMGSAANFGWLKRDGWKHYVGDYKPRHVARGGDLIITNTEQTWRQEIIGWPMLVPSDIHEALFTHHTYLVDFSAESAWMRLALWAHLFTNEARAVLDGSIRGTTVANLPIGAVEALTFPVPTEDSTHLDAGRALLESAWADEVAQIEFSRTRDELLPLLMSGKVRVSEDLAVA